MFTTARVKQTKTNCISTVLGATTQPHAVVNKQTSTTQSPDVNSSSVGHQTRQSMFNANRRLSAGTGAQDRPIDLQEEEGQALPLAEPACYMTASLQFNSGPVAERSPGPHASCDVYM